MEGLWVLSLLVLFISGASARNYCDIIYRGECYRPSLEGRVCLETKYDGAFGLCGSRAETCCTKWSERSVGMTESLCQTIYQGECISLLNPGPRRCREYASKSSHLCQTSSQICCKRFYDDKPVQPPKVEDPTCLDLFSGCERYPSYFCLTSNANHQFMKVNCKRTCGFCQPSAMVTEPPVTECSDKFSQCFMYPAHYCTEYSPHYQFMKRQCRKHCGFCRDTGSVGGGDTGSVGGGDTSGGEKPSGSCGVASIPVSSGWRIVNGEHARKGSWPWQVSLKFSDLYSQHFCGGSIIDKHWILTAAHCISDKSPWQMKVTVGEHDQAMHSAEQRDYNVDQNFPHPGFEAYGNRASPNDIGLIRLRDPIQFTDHVQPVCLPSGRRPGHFDGHQECWITGWGDTRGTSEERYLQQLKSAAWSNDACSKYWGYVLKPSMICVGDQYRSACAGDSGGPMVCKENNVWYQVGATSFGHRECQGMPSVYTRVTSFIGWIQQVTGIQL